MRSRCIYLTILSLLFFTSLSYASLVDIKTNDGIVYFLQASPNKIVRYETSSQTFLDEILLTKSATAFTIDGSDIYIAYNRELRKLSTFDETNEFIRNTSTDIKEVFTLSNNIYAAEGNGDIHVITKEDYSLLQTYDAFNRGQSYLAAQEYNSYLYRTLGTSPSDLRKVVLSDSGTITTDSDSPYHGDYPTASKIYLNNTGNKVYDNTGIVYFVADMSYIGSLAGSVDALTFSNDSAIAARGSKLFLYSPSLIDLGEINLNDSPIYLEADSDNVYSFYESNSLITVTINNLEEFNLPSIGSAVDPTSIEFTPESVETNNEDILYLLDRETHSIFSWSLKEGGYVNSWPLLNPPTWMSYSLQHKRLYLGYDSGKITYFDTSLEEPHETHLTNLALSVEGLLAVEDYLFAVDSSGSWNTHYSLDKNGNIINSQDWRHTSNEYVYSPLTNKIYHYRNGISPNDIEWTEFDEVTGFIGNNGDSPYHGSTLISRAPLRVNRLGDTIVNGAGQLLNTDTLSIQNNLSNNIQDAAWFENEILITLNDDASKLQFWGENYGLESEVIIQSAEYARVFNIAGDIVILTELNGRPTVYLYDLNNLPDSDSDGIHDLKDNCINDANLDQANFDNDSYGDACDLDDDNDGLSDLLEITFGLNTQDASDADSDLDNDQFSNRIEIALNSDINDALSTPILIKEFNEGFENGWPILISNTDNLGWALTDDSYQGISAIVSSPLSKSNSSSEFHLYNYFDTGFLSFQLKSDGDRYYHYNLIIEVDGVEIKTIYGNTSNTWSTQSFTINKGVHKVSFKVVLNRDDNTIENTRFWIDDLSFGKDSDNDGIADNIDNCPNHSNSSQYDSDNDGKGNECDATPWGNDRDNDDISDYDDNCPDTYNPDQANLDNDFYGDACDLTDDRPKDSDNDGLDDSYDNCPLTHNSMQEDLDADGIGDKCDADTDGDGILNSVEEKHQALDPNDPNDAYADFDNDGASNVWEVFNGQSPDVKDDYKTFNLFEYMPLGNITYVFGEGASSLTNTVSSTGKSNQFEVNFNNEIKLTLERTQAGIYVTEIYYPSYNQKAVCKNYLFLPAKMTLGQFIESEGSCSFYENEIRIASDKPAINRYELISESTFEWKGEVYPSLILSNFSGGGTMFVKGMGEVRANGKPLSSFNADIDTNYPSGKSKSSSALGQMNFGFLFILLSLIFIRKRK